MGKENQADNRLTTGQAALLVYVGICLALAVLTLGIAFQGEQADAAANMATPTVHPMVLTIRAEDAISGDYPPHTPGAGQGQQHGEGITATPPPDASGQ